MRIVCLSRLNAITSLPPNLTALQLVMRPRTAMPATTERLVTQIEATPLPRTRQVHLMRLVRAVIICAFPHHSHRRVTTVLNLASLGRAQFCRRAHRRTLQSNHRTNLQRKHGMRTRSLVVQRLAHGLNARLPRTLRRRIERLPLRALRTLNRTLFSLATLTSLRA